jgi:hypothetical protein
MRHDLDPPWWVEATFLTGEELLFLASDERLQSLQAAFDALHHGFADREFVDENDEEVGRHWKAKNRKEVERAALMVANLIATLRMVIKDAGGLA